MTTWTQSARQSLDDYCSRLRNSLAASGADPHEVTDDLRRHIEGEIAARRLEVVTEADVRTFLSSLGNPEAEVAPRREHQPTPTPVRASEKSLHFTLLFFGVLLPALTLGIELVTHMCAGVFFDPIPSWWHVLLVALVPGANFAAWWAVRSAGSAHRGLISFGNAFAAGVSLFYAVLYLPLLPFSLIAVVYLGWGLLPLSPLLSFITALRLRKHLKELSPERLPLGPGIAGLGTAVIALLLLVAPTVATRYWAGLAEAESSATRARAIKWLRLVGNEETLLRDCYGQTSWSANTPFGFNLQGQPIPAERAREVYFRVTGQAFNTVPPPQRKFTRGGWGDFNDFTWDREQGGEVVAGRVKGLWLVNSRLDGLLETADALGYAEWTLEFRNDSLNQQEARAQIALPPGGVVSRLTLWVNGEEREAAFAGKSQVREAYQKVAIRQRRDPVLVTSCGPDRVLMQCFPVPPQGGVIKIRVGITAPMSLLNAHHGLWRWPHFLERNFSLPDDFSHAVWAQSKCPLTSPGGSLTTGAPQAGCHSLHGQLSDNQLSDPQHGARAENTTTWQSSWVNEPSGSTIIEQIISESHPAPPKRVVVVLDGSQSMADVIHQLAPAFASFPAGVELGVILAADGLHEIDGSPRYRSASELRQLVAYLEEVEPVGGQDNTPALLRAWDLAASSGDGVVVWIHGPQPVVLQSIEALRQKLEWQPARPLIYDFQTSTGPNRIAEQLDGLLSLKAFPRSGDLRGDLDRYISALGGKVASFDSTRTRRPLSDARPAPEKAHGSKHLARLWAFGEVMRLKGARQLADAAKLAAQYQLVTAVSGAVVLETADQFAQAGLEPVDVNSVPSVPEPSSLFLFGAGIVVMWLVYRRQRRRAA